MAYLSENRGRYDDFRVHLVHLEFSCAGNYISILVDMVPREGFAPGQLVTKSVNRFPRLNIWVSRLILGESRKTGGISAYTTIECVTLEGRPCRQLVAYSG